MCVWVCSILFYLWAACFLRIVIVNGCYNIFIYKLPLLHWPSHSAAISIVRHTEMEETQKYI